MKEVLERKGFLNADFLVHTHTYWTSICSWMMYNRYSTYQLFSGSDEGQACLQSADKDISSQQQFSYIRYWQIKTYTFWIITKHDKLLWMVCNINPWLLQNRVEGISTLPRLITRWHYHFAHITCQHMRLLFGNVWISMRWLQFFSDNTWKIIFDHFV